MQRETRLSVDIHCYVNISDFGINPRKFGILSPIDLASVKIILPTAVGWGDLDD